jgi:hypothetical protein
MPGCDQQSFPGGLGQLGGTNMSECYVADVDPEISPGGWKVIFMLSQHNVPKTLVGGVDRVQGREGRCERPKDHRRVALQWRRKRFSALKLLANAGRASPAPARRKKVARTVVSSKFGLSSLTKSQAAFSAKVLLA